MANSALQAPVILGITARGSRQLRIKQQLTTDEFPQLLALWIAEKYDGLGEAAKQWKVSRQFIEQMLKGSRPAPKKICDELGYTKIKTVSYIKNK